MNDVHRKPKAPFNEDHPETAFCIKQEPLEIEPDDFPDGEDGSSFDLQSASKDTQNTITNISEASSSSVVPRSKVNFGLQIMATEDVDENLLEPTMKRKRTLKRSPKSKRLKALSETTKHCFKCPEKDCDYSCASARTLNAHLRLRHNGSRSIEETRKRRKNKALDKAAPEACQSDDEVESSLKQEVADVSGVVVRIEKTNNKGRVMYTCSRCKQVFRKREAAEAHIAKVHMDVKRYTCSDCGRGFHRSRDLEEHARVHTGERPFKCPAENCNYSASWSNTLYRHVRRRHKDYKGGLTLTTVVRGEPDERKLLPDIRNSQKAENQITGERLEANLVHANENRNTEVTTDIEDPSLVVMLSLGDVEEDSGQLNPYEEAMIIDNRTDKASQFSCSICTQDFENLHSIKRHVNEDHIDVKKRTCHMCGQTLNHVCNLSAHMRSHTGERPFKCGGCDKGFVTSSDLRRHARRLNHTIGLKERRHTCLVCEHIFDTFDELEKHISIHVTKPDPQISSDLKDNCELTPYEDAKLTVTESSPSQVYTCNICNMQFSVLSEAKFHVNNDHKDVKRQSCLYCGFTTSSRSTRKTHMKIHVGNKLYKCDKCTYATTLSTNLQIHQRDCANISSRTTVRQCTICQEEFEELSTLRVHLKAVHNVTKHHHCPHCENTFAFPSDLARHILSHGGVQPFRCPIEGCQFTLTSEEDQRKHLRWHEKKSNPPPRPFVCGICGKDFEARASLLRHTNKLHSR